MITARIIPMSEEYRDKLIEYMHKKYPTFIDAYIQFDVDEAIGTKESGTKSIIVINDNNEIVGCHLSFITKAWIKGEEKTIVWGHNTFLEEEYRKIIGLDFMLEIHSIKDGFGYSLSDINAKIQKKFKSTVFISGLRLYSLFKISLFWSIACKPFGKVLKIPTQLPQNILVKNDTFYLCKNARDIHIPNNGYWNKDICEVDFIRDEFFLNRRFFNNPVNKYYVYTNQERNCYFVVRPILQNGFLSVQMVDCRYMPHQQEIAYNIFTAIERICMTIHAGKIFVTTSDKLFKSILENKKLCKSWPIAFVCGKCNVSSKDSYIIVNAADSDGEYHA